MSERENEVLLHLAQSVADGQPVDWEAASLSGEASVQRIKRLQILASIATACGMPPAPVAAAPAGEVLFRWGHLEIREKIGEGVFGDVYRAWETTLEREVAVKFLRAGATPEAAHVLQEGRFLAKIRCPGVVTVYGAEQLDDRIGIWMEYVCGRTLEDLLQEQGPFAAREAIQIGIDLCRALTAVHEAGLVHRDVKTRNVVCADDGRIVLMDFGTGIDVHPGNAAAHAFAGTPIYLAPEILQGDAASPQSDVYGLGVLLYRLVTRSYPIGGDDLDALRDAHTRGEARPLRDARPDLPASFVQVVERALAADPGQRFASAAQMEKALGAALDAPRTAVRRRAGILAFAGVAVLGLCVALAVHRWRVASSAPPAGRPTVVVTDFVNETQEADLDALASMLVTSLEQSHTFSVLTRSRMNDILKRSNKQAADRIDADLGAEICRQAGAGMLLIPSIRRVGGRYRLALEGIDPRKQKRLFIAHEEANDQEQIPAMIDALSERTRIALKEEPRATRRPLAQITTTNLRAYRHYDLGEKHIDNLEMHAARAELEAAITLDSTFGLAHSRLAYVHWWSNDTDNEHKQLAAAFALLDRIPERQRYLLRAQGAMANREGLEAARSILLEMEPFYPDDKEMLYDIGDYSSHLNEFPTAIRYLEKVIAMDADFVRALQHLARVYRDLGRRDSFLEWAQRYAAADSSWDSCDLLGNAQIAAGDFAVGLATLQRGNRLASARPQDFTLFVANAYAFQGRHAEAEAEWSRLLDDNGRVSKSYSYLARGRIRAHRGAYRGAQEDLQRAVALYGQERNQLEEALAQVDAAFLWMLARNDAHAALTHMEQSAAIESVITYRDTYFSFWIYWGGLFKLQLLSGNLHEAEALARRKFAADKWYGPYVAAYLHAAKGECAPALAAASRVLEWGPAAENIELLYFLARCQFEHGQLREAVESLHQLQSLHSNSTLSPCYYAKSMHLLGKVHEKRGDTGLAIQSYEKLLDFWRGADRDLPDLLDARDRLERVKTLPVKG